MIHIWIHNAHGITVSKVCNQQHSEDFFLAKGRVPLGNLKWWSIILHWYTSVLVMLGNVNRILQLEPVCQLKNEPSQKSLCEQLPGRSSNSLLTENMPLGISFVSKLLWQYNALIADLCLVYFFSTFSNLERRSKQTINRSSTTINQLDQKHIIAYSTRTCNIEQNNINNNHSV